MYNMFTQVILNCLVCLASTQHLGNVFPYQYSPYWYPSESRFQKTSASNNYHGLNQEYYPSFKSYHSGSPVTPGGSGPVIVVSPSQGSAYLQISPHDDAFATSVSQFSGGLPTIYNELRNPLEILFSGLNSGNNERVGGAAERQGVILSPLETVNEALQSVILTGGKEPQSVSHDSSQPVPLTDCNKTELMGTSHQGENQTPKSESSSGDSREGGKVSQSGVEQNRDKIPNTKDPFRSGLPTIIKIVPPSSLPSAYLSHSSPSNYPWFPGVSYPSFYSSPFELSPSSPFNNDLFSPQQPPSGNVDKWRSGQTQSNFREKQKTPSLPQTSLDAIEILNSDYYRQDGDDISSESETFSIKGVPEHIEGSSPLNQADKRLPNNNKPKFHPSIRPENENLISLLRDRNGNFINSQKFKTSVTLEDEKSVAPSGPELLEGTSPSSGIYDSLDSSEESLDFDEELKGLLTEGQELLQTLLDFKLSLQKNLTDIPKPIDGPNSQGLESPVVPDRFGIGNFSLLSNLLLKNNSSAENVFYGNPNISASSGSGFVFGPGGLLLFSNSSSPENLTSLDTSFGPAGFTWPHGSPFGPAGFNGPHGSPFGPTGFTGPHGSPFGPAGLTGPHGSPFGPAGFTGPHGSPFGPAGFTGPHGSPFGPAGFTGPHGSPFGPAGFMGSQGNVFGPFGQYGIKGIVIPSNSKDPVDTSYPKGSSEKSEEKGSSSVTLSGELKVPGEVVEVKSPEKAPNVELDDKEGINGTTEVHYVASTETAVSQESVDIDEKTDLSSTAAIPKEDHSQMVKTSESTGAVSEANETSYSVNATEHKDSSTQTSTETSLKETLQEFFSVLPVVIGGVASLPFAIQDVMNSFSQKEFGGSEPQLPSGMSSDIFSASIKEDSPTVDTKIIEPAIIYNKEFNFPFFGGNFTLKITEDIDPTPSPPGNESLNTDSDSTPSPPDNESPNTDSDSTPSSPDNDFLNKDSDPPPTSQREDKKKIFRATIVESYPVEDVFRATETFDEGVTPTETAEDDSISITTVNSLV